MINSKKTSILAIFMAISLMSLSACSSPAPSAPAPTSGAPENTAQAPQSADAVKINLGHALSESTPASQLIDQFAANINEKTNGRVFIEVFPNSQFGSETDMVEQMQIGSLEAAGIMIGSLQAVDMRMAIEDLPYMWADIEHARQAYDGEFGEKIAGVMSDHGFHKVSFVEWGFRHITNNRAPIVVPEDVKGLKIRVAQTKLRVDTFEQLGAIPTVMAFSELYGALQQGVVDAQENPLSNIVSANFNEVQKHLSLTGHFYNTVMVMINNNVWDKISPEDQKLIEEEGAKLSQAVRVENDLQEDSYVTELESRGMLVEKNVDKEAFRSAMLPVYDKWEQEHLTTELMDVYRSASGY